MEGSGGQAGRGRGRRGRGEGGQHHGRGGVNDAPGSNRGGRGRGRGRTGRPSTSSVAANNPARAPQPSDGTDRNPSHPNGKPSLSSGNKESGQQGGNARPATNGRGRGRGGRGRGRSGTVRTTSNDDTNAPPMKEQASVKSPDVAPSNNTPTATPSGPKRDKQTQQSQPTKNVDETKPSKVTNVKDNNRGKSSAKSKGPYSAPLPTSSNTPSSIPPNQSQQSSSIHYGKGESITILHVAEKPSIATAIAKGLDTANSSRSRSKALPVHEFSNPPFPKAPQAATCHHRVTSVAGHVFSVDFPAQYQSWESVDPAELFLAPVLKTPCKGSVVKHLQDEARNVNFIVLWMDCDREGENINFEVLDCCMHLMKAGGSDSNYDRVYRAYFSAINPSDIQKAYQALGKPDKHQALSVDARQELDLKVGVAFSRFQTRYFQGRYGDLDSAVLSYGPCQTPTLGFCVQRHIDIETFKPEPFWVLELGILKRGRSLKALWASGRSFNKNRVEQLLTLALESEPIVEVTDVAIKEKKQGRPTPLNTVALLKACSKALGIGPHAAMQTAERLYLSGYLSYPRTESTAYPQSFDIKGTLEQQIGDSRWGPAIRDLLRETGPQKGRGGVDHGDHPPITPCRAARPNELIGDMARVYELVVRHFIASVSPDAIWRSTRVDFTVPSLNDKGQFTLRGKELVTPGFLAILLHKEYGEERDVDNDDEDEEERSIPEFSKGELIRLVSNVVSTSSKVTVASSEPVRATLDIREKMTTSPTYLTESELIGMMEKHGIGTDASIATHIENVQKRNYVTLETGRRLIPSKLGLVLVQGYHQIDSSLVLPQVRSDIESQCNKIAQGQASKDVVVKSAIELFRNKYDHFVNCIEKMDVLFGSSFLKLEDVGKPFTRCGFTRRYLQYIPGPPPRLYNKWTETVYPVPVGGMLKQWTGRHCAAKDCNFEMSLYIVGQPPRTFPFCPRCYNDPDYALDAATLPTDPVDRQDEGKEREIRKMAGKALVLECPLPDNHPSIGELTVSPDPDSDGVLILDPHLGPKWRLVSTRAPTVVYLPQSVEKLTVLHQKDDVMDIHWIQVDFKASETPLPNGQVKHVCCFPSDELIQGLVRVYHGSERTKASGRGGRGRGRGRGGGRSGRGERERR